MAQPDAALDAALLREYVGSGSERAFRLIVERYLPLVHAAARRQVREAQLADDVTQAVFILLARKARSISNPMLLLAWLLKVAHYASLDARKTESRRRSHERKAAEMSESTSDDRSVDDELTPLLPLLDGALARLGDRDRAVVAMRYLEGRSVNEVASAAGISEAAAGKRIERALVKLRAIFKRAGTALPAAAVIAALDSAKASAGIIPSTSAAAISTTALSTAQGIVSGAAASMSIAKGTGQLMAIAKAKTVVAIVFAAVLTMGGGGLLVHHFSGQPGTPAAIPAAVISSTPTAPPTVNIVDPVKAAPVPPAEEKVVPPPAPIHAPTQDKPTAPPQITMRVGGTVTLKGEAPAMPQIDMSAVAQCGHQHAVPVTQETVLVGKNGGLANVVISVKKEEGMDLPGDAPKDAAVLDQKGCQYSPHVVAVMVGQGLQIKNSDPFLHNVHTLPEKNEGQNMAQPTVGEGKLKTPKEAEVFRVKCDVHPWMGAWVAVIDNPYFAVTDKDGKFTLPKGLPDGDYTLRAWHEKYGEQEAKLTVKGGVGSAALIYQAGTER